MLHVEKSETANIASASTSAKIKKLSTSSTSVHDDTRKKLEELNLQQEDLIKKQEEYTSSNVFGEKVFLAETSRHGKRLSEFDDENISDIENQGVELRFKSRYNHRRKIVAREKNSTALEDYYSERSSMSSSLTENVSADEGISQETNVNREDLIRSAMYPKVNLKAHYIPETLNELKSMAAILDDDKKIEKNFIQMVEKMEDTSGQLLEATGALNIGFIPKASRKERRNSYADDYVDIEENDELESLDSAVSVDVGLPGKPGLKEYIELYDEFLADIEKKIGVSQRNRKSHKQNGS